MNAVSAADAPLVHSAADRAQAGVQESIDKTFLLSDAPLADPGTDTTRAWFPAR